jgi:hypothetical protein
MNERIKELALKAGGGLSCIAEPLEHPWKFSERELEKFAELIVKECTRLNRTQSFELAGVVVDTEDGHGFDSVCLTTVKRVEQYLAGNDLLKHFGVEE